MCYNKQQQPAREPDSRSGRDAKADVFENRFKVVAEVVALSSSTGVSLWKVMG